MSLNKLKHLISFAMLLALVVILLGAYTRLTNAGLGCPDWPGCYGHMVLPHDQGTLHNAAQQYGAAAVAPVKAWTEMIHRYIAGSLGVILLLIVTMVWRLRSQRPYAVKWAVALLLILAVQATLGMWTVTLKLLPLVVSSHLLFGFSLLTCLLVLRLSVGSSSIEQVIKPMERTLLLFGFGITVFQIALGAWVSTNYAGLACIGFPQCNGQLLPALHWSQAFNLHAPLGINYEGGVLNSASRVTIQVVHRFGAIFVASFWLMAGVYFSARYAKLRSSVLLIIVCVLCQFALGILNVLYLLPLPVAVAHNGMAALLLLSVAAINYRLWPSRGKSV